MFGSDNGKILALHDLNGTFAAWKHFCFREADSIVPCSRVYYIVYDSVVVFVIVWYGIDWCVIDQGIQRTLPACCSLVPRCSWRGQKQGPSGPCVWDAPLRSRQKLEFQNCEPSTKKPYVDAKL